MTIYFKHSAYLAYHHHSRLHLHLATVCRLWSSTNRLSSCCFIPSRVLSERIFLCLCTRVVRSPCSCNVYTCQMMGPCTAPCMRSSSYCQYFQLHTRASQLFKQTSHARILCLTAHSIEKRFNACKQQKEWCTCPRYAHACAAELHVVEDRQSFHFVQSKFTVEVSFSFSGLSLLSGGISLVSSGCIYGNERSAILILR